MKTKKVEFQPPDGFVLPEGTMPGDRVTLLGEFQVNKDGNLCLAELDGIPMPGYDDGDKDESEPTGKGFVGNVMEGMTQGNSEGGY